MSGAERRELLIAGLKTEVFTQGTGEPLVFLHPGDGIEWSLPFVASLSRHFRVIAPSHPGFGGSALPAEFDSVDDLASFYLDFLDHLGERVVLAGASFGGWIAAEIATRNLASISRVVLIGGLGVKFGGREQREIADIFSVPLPELPRLLSKTVTLPVFSEQPEEATLRFARNRESLSLFAWSPTLHNPKLRYRLHRIHVPSLVLWGEDDRVASVSYGRAYAAALPSARFESISNAGHYVHVDKPEEVAKRIAMFAGAGARADVLAGAAR